MNIEHIRERTTNILKRVSSKYYRVVDIDNTRPDGISIELCFSDGSCSIILLPYPMLQRWYDNQRLKYDEVVSYLLEVSFIEEMEKAYEQDDK